MTARGILEPVSEIYSAKVKNGQIVIDDRDAVLPEGAEVTVFVGRDEAHDFEPTPEQIAELEAALVDADAGEEGIPWEEFRATLLPPQE
jgi:hypothetical protein